MNNIFKQIVILICLIAILILPYFVFAQTGPLNELQNVAEEGGYDASTDESTMAGIIAVVVKAFLGLLGVIFLILMIYAGYIWMTAGGEEEKVTKAKDTIRRAIIGLIIVVAAYSITYFVFKNLPSGGGGSGTVTSP